MGAIEIVIDLYLLAIEITASKKCKEMPILKLVKKLGF